MKSDKKEDIICRGDDCVEYVNHKKAMLAADNDISLLEVSESQ